MLDILFYIFASLIAISALYIAFTANTINSIKGFAYFIIGLTGFLLLLNSHLLSLLITLILTIITAAGILSKEIIFKYIDGDIKLPRVNIISLLVISLLSAVMASLLGAGRWQMINIDYGINSLSLIFTKYITVILLIALLSSALISSAIRIVKNTESDI